MSLTFRPQNSKVIVTLSERPRGRESKGPYKTKDLGSIGVLRLRAPNSRRAPLSMTGVLLFATKVSDIRVKPAEMG
jgi:hypothetical protein